MKFKPGQKLNDVNNSKAKISKGKRESNKQHLTYRASKSERERERERKHSQTRIETHTL